MEQFSASTFGSLLLLEVDNNHADFVNDSDLKKFVLDPRKDIKGVSVFGNNSDDGDAVVSVAGDFNHEKIQNEMAKQKAQEIIFGKYVIYTVGGKPAAKFLMACLDAKTDS
jgi:rRNA pseudouridine-1189 N-methylase Emg1 (Nep1/Mra1 family)